MERGTERGEKKKKKRGGENKVRADEREHHTTQYEGSVCCERAAQHLLWSDLKEQEQVYIYYAEYHFPRYNYLLKQLIKNIK